MLSLKNILLFTTAVSAFAIPELIERDAKSTQQNLTNINSDTVTFTQKVNNYVGGLTVLDVVQAQNNLNDDIKSSTTYAQNSGAVTATEAQSIIDYINNTLEPNIKKAMTAMKSKKSQFQSDGYGQTALDGLKNTKTNTDNFGAPLLKNTPSSKTSAANAAQAKIDADFDDAISYYSS
ncbi:hypothetical protein HII31_01403 [Pseudocercospora fuligena]|uniref:Uncharacterized protein n=1 Tax=Pseudocercospora fuligena TaxID=685502 RepID=A0A8H6VLX8_9PEZI|nr:hypothetical protein HII31_01403 [Pseudocercospora fuligena]